MGFVLWLWPAYSKLSGSLHRYLSNKSISGYEILIRVWMMLSCVERYKRLKLMMMWFVFLSRVSDEAQRVCVVLMCVVLHQASSPPSLPPPGARWDGAVWSNPRTRHWPAIRATRICPCRLRRSRRAPVSLGTIVLWRKWAPASSWPANTRRFMIVFIAITWAWTRTAALRSKHSQTVSIHDASRD